MARALNMGREAFIDACGGAPSHPGENIAAEIRDVCLAANANLQVYRAKFSAVTQRDVEAACRALARLDER
jgi:DNA topoisomerase IA